MQLLAGLYFLTNAIFLWVRLRHCKKLLWVRKGCRLWVRKGMLENVKSIQANQKMNPMPKQKREKDPGYLKHIREQGCLVPDCLYTPSDAHHSPSVGSGGSDYATVPLCRKHHSECHLVGRKTFQEKFGVDFKEERVQLLIGYIRKLKQK